MIWGYPYFWKHPHNSTLFYKKSALFRRELRELTGTAWWNSSFHPAYSIPCPKTTESVLLLEGEGVFFSPTYFPCSFSRFLPLNCFQMLPSFSKKKSFLPKKFATSFPFTIFGPMCFFKQKTHPKTPGIFLLAQNSFVPQSSISSG